MKIHYKKPAIIVYEIIIEDCMAAASVPLNIGGPNGLDFKYNSLEEQQVIKDDWEFLDQ